MRSPAGGEPYPYALEGEVEAAACALRRGAGEWVAAHAAHAAHAGEAGAGEPPPAVIRLAPLFAAVLDDLEAGAVGARLHATVAAFVLDVCRPHPAADVEHEGRDGSVQAGADGAGLKVVEHGGE